MMKKTLSILILAMVSIAAFVSCSDDPRVAPTKIYIVNISGAKDISFDAETGLRLITIAPGEEIDLSAITNRLGENGECTWYSSLPQFATVGSTDGHVTGILSGGATVISVETAAGRRQATCLVVVREPGQDLDPDDMPDGFMAKTYIYGSEGGYVENAGNVDIVAPTEADLQDDDYALILNYIQDPRYEYSKFVWTVTDPSLNDETFTSKKGDLDFTNGIKVSFSQVGTYEISCKVTLTFNGKPKEEPIRAITVTVNVED